MSGSQGSLLGGNAASITTYGGAPAWDAATGTVYDALTGHPFGGGGVFSLFGAAVNGGGSASYYTPGGNASAITSLLGSFTEGAFGSLQNSGLSYYQGLGTYAEQASAFQASFADRIASVFENIAKNSAKAPSSLFGSIFG